MRKQTVVRERFADHSPSDFVDLLLNSPEERIPTLAWLRANQHRMPLEAIAAEVEERIGLLETLLECLRS